MTEQDAIAPAKSVAQREDWTWLEPVDVRCLRRVRWAVFLVCLCGGTVALKTAPPWAALASGVVLLLFWCWWLLPFVGTYNVNPVYYLVGPAVVGVNIL